MPRTDTPARAGANEAAMRADEFLDQGNIDGQRVWLRIMQAIEELQRGAAEGGGGPLRR